MIYKKSEWQYLIRELKLASIVMISGFFDPLHGGHIDSIEEAIKLSRPNRKVLVVVNGNLSTINKKGYLLLPIEHRLQVIDSIKGVDYVTELDHDNVSEAIISFRPDYFLKSGDRQINNLNQEEIKAAQSVRCKILIDATSKKTGSSSNFFKNAVNQYFRGNQ